MTRSSLRGRGSSRPPDPSSFTTAFIRNVPRTYTASDVARDIERFVGRETFNFVYVPCGKGAKSKANMGFGFVNFVDHRSLLMAITRMNDQAWANPANGEGATRNMMQWSLATVQGFAENLRRFDCAQHGHPPLIVVGGRQIPLSEAMQVVCSETGFQTASLLSKPLHQFQVECSHGDPFFEIGSEGEFN